MAFADKDKTVFVERDAQGALRGIWTVRQAPDQEELLENDPAVLAFRARLARSAGARQIDVTRDAQIESGAVDWNAKRWHIDAVFQCHLTGLITAYSSGILAPAALTAIRTADNETMQLGFVEIKALAAAVLARVQAIYAQSWADKDAL